MAPDRVRQRTERRRGVVRMRGEKNGRALELPRIGSGAEIHTATKI